MSTAFSNAHLWNIPFVMGDVITSLWSKETPRRMYESKRAKKHKSIQQRLNDCGITYWVLNRFTNCIASKFMLCFTSILCCFTGCLGKQTAHYLLRLLTTNTLLTTFTFPHTTHARRSSGRVQLIMYFISHIQLPTHCSLPSLFHTQHTRGGAQADYNWSCILSPTSSYLDLLECNCNSTLSLIWKKNHMKICLSSSECVCCVCVKHLVK